MKIQNSNSFELEKGSIIGKNALIFNSEFKGLIRIGENISCGGAVLRGKINLGNNNLLTDVKIAGTFTSGEGCKIINGVNLSGKITIGNYTSLNGPNMDMITKVNEVVIGNFCSIARNVSFQEFNHDFNQLTSYYVNKNLKNKNVIDDINSKGAIILGHDVWIGTQCVILSGVNIGTGAVIAANSVVTNDIPPYAIAAGSPAKVIKYRFNEATIKFLLSSEWWNKPKEEIIKFYDEFRVLRGNKYHFF